jgi:hypothetical protein
MTRAEAEEVLGQRYRIRILVELEHSDIEGGLVQLKGSTMVERPEEIGVGIVGLVELMAPRLMRAVLGGEGDGEGEGRQGPQGDERIQGGDTALGVEEGAPGEVPQAGHRHRPL